MKVYNAKNIRNIVIAGHGGRGKTTLAEAMLYLSKATDRLGRVADGNTVMDFDAEEKKRKISVSTAVAPLEWKDTKINLLDTPGQFDFAAGLSEGVRAAEAALIVTAAGSGYDVGAEKAVKAANKRGIAKMFAVTRCDAENTDFYKTFEALHEVHKTELCPVIVPYVQGDKVAAYVNFATGKAYSYNGGKAAEVAMPEDDNIEEMKAIFSEAVASADDELMEKFLMEEPFTADEVKKGLGAGIASGDIIPVFACAGYTADAVDMLLDCLADYAPNAADYAGEGDLKCDEAGDLAAICFKTIADPFVGRMSFFKVVSGKITSDLPAYCARTGESERMGKLVVTRGGKQEDVAAIPAGDIGVVTKLSGFKTGDTLCNPKKVIELDAVEFPAPCLSMAVKTKKKGEEEKVTSGLLRLAEEDLTITYVTNKETREQVLSGMGEQHLDVIISKLKAKFGVDVDLTVPRVAYRETIRKVVDKQGRHKKQSGGHGQFGDVWIRFEPLDGEDFIFTSDEVVGGSVPKNYFPAVEKGLRESIARGMIAGYPMVGIKAALHDGSYHPVDSSEMAFKTAAQIAFKNAIPEAKPTILEPFGTLKVQLPKDNLGDIMSDVTKRRGRVLGIEHTGEHNMRELIAEVPMAEMGNFSTILRSVTAGRGSFSIEFARYEDAPADVANKVIEEAKAAAEEE